MIDKVKELNIDLPKMKDGQNRNITGLFFKHLQLINNNDMDIFTDYEKQIKYILENDLYVPQEIINITDL